MGLTYGGMLQPACPKVYDMTTAQLSLTICMLKVEVVDTLLYGCAKCTLNVELYGAIDKAHLQVIRRVLSFQYAASHTNPYYGKAVKNKMGEHRTEHVKTAALVRGGHGTAKLVLNIQPGTLCTDRQRGKLRSR